MRSALLLTAVMLVACGDSAGVGDDGTSTAAIHLATALETATKKVGVRIFAPRDHDNIIVTCTSLLTGNPADSRYDVLQSADFDYPPAPGASITVDNVAAKDGAVIYVNARDATDIVIGEGCEAGVNVKGGATATVNIMIYPAS